MVNYIKAFDKKRKFIWFVVPKAGYCSMAAFLYGSEARAQGHFSKNNLDDKHSPYFKFCFVRNPWDRLVSCYQQKILEAPWVNRSLNHPGFRWDLVRKKASFKEFVLEITNTNENLEKDTHWAPIHSFIPVSKLDFIGKIENFQEDVNVVCDKIGIPHQKLPHLNKTKHKHYTEYYDDETRQIIAEKYARDIDSFGYKF